MFLSFSPQKAKIQLESIFFLQEVKFQKYSSCRWPDWRLFTGIVRAPADGGTLQVGVQHQAPAGQSAPHGKQLASDYFLLPQITTTNVRERRQYARQSRP